MKISAVFPVDIIANEFRFPVSCSAAWQLGETNAAGVRSRAADAASHANPGLGGDMSEWANLAPDGRFAGLKEFVMEKMESSARSLAGERFQPFADAAMRDLLFGGIVRAGGQEATIWLVDAAGESLVASLTIGPHAASLSGNFAQPLSSGMISLVFASEQAICENEVFENREHDKTLDKALGVKTEAMVAVPLHFVKKIRGVISVVQFKSREDQPETSFVGFNAEALPVLQSIASILSRLVEHRLLATVVGWL
jgi:hypothetical protein